MQTFVAGDTVIIQVAITNAGTYIAPSNSVTCAILDKEKRNIVAAQAMTNNDLGKYSYDWQTDAVNTSTGVYYARVTSINGTRTKIEDKGIRIG